jgi:hypothetical protein
VGEKRRETWDREMYFSGEGVEGTVCKMKQVHPQFYSLLPCYGSGYYVGENEKLCGYLLDFTITKATALNSQK